MIETKLVLKNESGLHARPAGLFVATATEFSSKIMITYNGETANAKSILFVLSLAIPMGGEFTLTADGEDEEQAIAKLTQIVNNKLGE